MPPLIMFIFKHHLPQCVTQCQANGYSFINFYFFRKFLQLGFVFAFKKNSYAEYINYVRF